MASAAIIFLSRWRGTQLLKNQDVFALEMLPLPEGNQLEESQKQNILKFIKSWSTQLSVGYTSA